MTMKGALFALGVVGLLGSVSAQTATHPIKATALKPAEEPAVCKSLMTDYDAVSKKLAMLEADGTGDDSAPRASMREAQASNAINQARITFDVMKANGCTMPNAAPSASRYSIAALACEAGRQKIRTQERLDNLQDKYVYYPEPKECDTDTWKPNQSR